MKFCECGCGKPAPIARRNNRRYGHIKGQPIRFIHGHQPSGQRAWNWRGGTSMTAGYRTVHAPDHPNASRGGHVLEHILVASRALGKPLPPRAVVHHVNEDPLDNRPENLVACEDQAYHMLLHQRMRARDACGDPNWLQCRHCKQYDAPESLRVPKDPSRQPYHRACDAKRAREYRARLAAARQEGVLS